MSVSPDTPDMMKRRSLDIPTLAENPATYIYEVTVVRLDGSVYQFDPIASDNPVALISDGAGTTHRIKVKLLGHTYKVTGYNLRGEIVPGFSAQTSDTTLFVKVPVS